MSCESRYIMPRGGTFYREKPEFQAFRGWWKMTLSPRYSWPPLYFGMMFWHVISWIWNLIVISKFHINLGFIFSPSSEAKTSQNIQLQIGDPTNNCDWLCWMLSKMPPIGKRHWNFSTLVRRVRNTFFLCFSIGEFPIKWTKGDNFFNNWSMYIP